MQIKIISPEGEQTVFAEAGSTLLDVLRGHKLQTPCGGRGTCGKCTVYLQKSKAKEKVLACRTAAEDGMEVFVPLPEMMQMNSRTENVTIDEKGAYGIACDIGTTTVVCQLVRRDTGEILLTRGEMNVQWGYGADVISRIKASMDGMGQRMTDGIREQLGSMILRLCADAGILPQSISYMAVAANTTMCHLLTGLRPDSLGRAPYVPESLFGDIYSSQQLSLPFTGDVYLLPAVSAFIGGDVVADVLSEALDKTDKFTLLIDIGTNGEIVLGCGEKFWCCSTAAGSAFEGAELCCGMTAAQGAICRVFWQRGRVFCETIGEGSPVGICGSGVIDALAMLLEIGAIDRSGRMLDADKDYIPEELEPYLYLEQGEPAFWLSDEVYITQTDVRKLQLGKAAIASGVETLRHACGDSEIKALLLAGGFKISPESAASIGLIPQELLSVTQAVGNGAIKGATMALCSDDHRSRLNQIQSSMNYLELSNIPTFQEAYIRNMMF